ncbi:DNA polymerase III subunit gamma/tau [Microbacterium rhizomatis]|uniref:DNA polymerase III subunit gamma/tau n=1 Tax=Microbacterium rhizomatis TaxID=1631477 RepID=A0A5J5J3R2_9MICO|nr:DNA polymerase III subunit gamma/tau [Microbacterium rhizomatis]KAA9110640.1 DNA polymerase III subunit gamma/tau [Microbacterium rhizomatis]
MTDRRDDALSWDGDDDPTLDTGIPADVLATGDSEPEPDPDPAPPALPGGFTAVGKDSDTVGRVEADGSVTMPTDPVPLGNAGLITLGILGGIYALWTIGWIIGGLRVHSVAGFLVSSDGSASPLWTGGNLVAVWLAVLAPAIWFGTVLWLTRGARPWLKWILLFVGAVLLVPWPFIMVGAVGA